MNKAAVGEKRFLIADMLAMGKSIAVSVFDSEFPNHPSVKIKSDACNGIAATRDWVTERIKRMYMKARVEIDPGMTDTLANL